MPLADMMTAYDSPTVIAIAARTDFIALVPKGTALHAMKYEDIAILGDAPGLSLDMAMLWHEQHRGDAAHRWLRTQILQMTAEIAQTGRSSRHDGAFV